MVTDAELVKSGGEVNRVPRKEILVDTVKCAINLYTVWLVKLVCMPPSRSCPKRTRKVMFPSLKKYLWCRMNESSHASALE